MTVPAGRFSRTRVTGQARRRIGVQQDTTSLATSIAIMLMAVVVLVGWYTHIPAAVQVFPGLNQMQYNTALCFLSLGAAGIGLATSRRLLLLGGGSFAVLMSGAVILEYATGVSFGIDTLFFYPWVTLGPFPGRMALITAISFCLTGSALVVVAARQSALGIFWMLNSVPLSLALTAIIGYVFRITYVLPFGLGLQMALNTAAAFAVYGTAMLGYAWKHAERGPDGLPRWAGGIAVAFLPVLLVGAGALFPRQSWQVLTLEVLVSIAGVALIALAMGQLTTVNIVNKGRLMTAIPLVMLLTFVALVVRAKDQNESAQMSAQHSSEVLLASESLLARIAEAESAVRAYVITGDETFVTTYERALTLASLTGSQLRTAVADNPPQEAKARRVEQLAAQRAARLSEIVRLRKSGNQKGAEDEVKGSAGTELMTRVRAEMEAFSQEEVRLAAERRQALDRSWQRLSWLLVAGTAAAILLASILTLSFSGGVSTRLRQLRDNAISLAAGRALAPRLAGDDEIAELDRVFHEMATSLLEITRREKAIIEGSTDGIVIKDLEHRYVLVNEGSAKLLGKTIKDVVGMTIFDLYEPDTAQRILEFDNEIMAGGETATHELVAALKGGEARIYSSTYGPYRDQHGKLIGVISISRDITMQKRAEALLKAGALQSAIFNSENFSSIATDANGVIQIFNVGAERMLGYTADEVMNKITPAEISDPQEVIARATALSLELGVSIKPGFEALVFKASRGIEDIYELTYFRKDGSRLPAVVSVTALRDAEGAIIGYLLIGTDNTARKQVEEERKKLDQRLRDQQFYTRSLIESDIDALMTTDPRGIITDVNKQTEALTGCTRDELIGAPFKNYFTDASRAEAGINRVLSEGKVTNYELTARARDGTQTVVSYNATTFYDRDRRLQGVFAAARDVTELKLFEQTLQQKNVELEAASRMKSEFLANMSHELRTPLNAIIGFSEVLRDGLMGELTDQQRGFIGDIFGSGKHLLSLINDILDLSKVEAGKMSLDLEPVAVSSLFVNSLSIIREKAAERRIRLDLAVDAAASLGSIQADPRKLKQVLYNLLSNAVKFTGDGGHVTVRADRVPRASVGKPSCGWAARSFPLADNTFVEFLEIRVKDNGIGISPEAVDRLFKPFSQVDSGLGRRFEGTGLGLVMVKMLVELHGGTVAVETAPGEGSCFTVWLPLRAAEERAFTPTSVPATPTRVEAQAGVRTALVVEDDPKSADLIRLQLESEGFKVLHAATAEVALAVVAQEPVSLITLDIMLPVMDGWEFLTRLKQVPDLRSIPVLIISIVADSAKGFALGAAAVMQKPISRQELSQSLVDLSLLPLSQGRTLRVLVVDDDPKAVELIAVRLLGLAGTVLRAYGGREAIEMTRRELPDLIVLDLMMPDVSGFDVVQALTERPETARIPILVVTAKQITAEDRTKLNGLVAAIMEKAGFDSKRFTAELRRAMSGRPVAA